MAAIVIQPHIDARGLTLDPADFMPLSARMKVAKELNALWEEFVTDMHDGPLVGVGIDEKFWKFVTTRGCRP